MAAVAAWPESHLFRGCVAGWPIRSSGSGDQIFVYHIPSKTLVTRLTDPALLKDGKYKDGVSHQDLVHSSPFRRLAICWPVAGIVSETWRRLPVARPSL